MNCKAILSVIALGAIILFNVAAIPASGECEFRESLVARLMLKFAEQPSSYGLADPRTIVELFEAEHGKTWTLVATRSGGVSCTIAAGQDWQRFAWAPGGRKL